MYSETSETVVENLRWLGTVFMGHENNYISVDAKIMVSKY